MKLRMLLCAAAASLSLGTPCAPTGWSQVIVIANTEVKSSSASRTDLREVFSGESSSFKDGSRVVPVLLRPGPTEDEFVATYLGKSDAAFRAAWRSLVFSGQAGMPRFFDSERAVVDYVSHNPGSIGYIDSRTAHDGVKVLAVK